MPEAFDTGPLSWVKDEIDQSLKKVLTSFGAVKQNISDYPALRFDLAHLYQVNGALDMVGLEGCKRYCSEIEKLTNKISQQQIAATEDLMSHLITAVETLSQYLQDLLNGMPDAPIKLFASLKPIVEAQGESLDESELFYPNIDHGAPRDLPQNPIEETAMPIYVAEQRALFQRALLEWLRTKSTDALAQMRDAIIKVQQVQIKNASRTLWWAASAFADSLAQDKVSDHLGAKKLCRKLDRQLGNLALGDVKAPSQLLRELLYYVAISDRVTELIARVKDVFDLDEAMPGEAADMQAALSSESERAALAQFMADLPALKELWANISISSIEASADALQSFVDKFDVLLESAQQNIINHNIVGLIEVITQAAHSLQTDTQLLNETAFIELAAALNLLEHCCSQYQQLDSETKQKISAHTERLQALIAGADLTGVLGDFAVSKLDDSVVTAVVKQIVDELVQVEAALDTFFRNPANRAVLDSAVKPLQQVVAAFEMLDIATPKNIAAVSALFVDLFKNASTEIELGKVYKESFELVAESLSMLGLYAQELPNARPESEIALIDALERMQQGAVEVGLDVSALLAANDSSVAQMIEEVTLSQALPDDASLIPSFVSSRETAIAKPELAEALADYADQTDEQIVDSALDSELLEIFLSEAEEVLAGLAQNLQALRVNATDSEAAVQVRRGYHTLKGSGRTVGLLALGEVAWTIENLLNQLTERKLFPTPELLSWIEKVTADFASWVAELSDKESVTLATAPYAQEANRLLRILEQMPVAKLQKEEVLIGGTRKLSKTFFDIFLVEAQQHLNTLLRVQDGIAKNTAESFQAAHTLGSNALTAGFKPIGDLARALEHWLDGHSGAWTKQHLTLYANVVKALAEGLESVKLLKEPKTTRALINALTESTTAMKTEASVQAEAAVIAAEKAAKPAKKPNITVVVNRVNPAEKSLQASTNKTEITAAANSESVSSAVQKADKVNAEKQEPQTVKLKAVNKLKDVADNTNAEPKQRQEPAINEELFALFLEEARELVPQIGKDLRGWRANPEETEYADSLQRVLHTLKGSARMAGLAAIGDSVHSMEDHVIRALTQKVNHQDFDTMFLEFDQIGLMLEQVAGVDAATIAADEDGAPAAAPVRRTEQKSQFLRLRADVLDRLINEAGEVSIMRSRMDRGLQNFKQSSLDLTDSISRLRAYLRELEIEAETQLQSRMNLLQEANEAFDPLEFDRFTRLQELTRMMAESVNDVSTIQQSLLLNLDQTDAALQQQNRMNRELQQGLMRVRMLPLATISERLYRIVRQTARELNKQVELRIDGENVELDRGVLDKLGAPLEHLLRNAVAHGLESTEERVKAGKSEIGHIQLKVSLENDEITLVITDDGAGVNLAKVKQKAIERGLLTEAQDATEQALMSIIFEPGFTTADEVSQIAGRGVGLDVVRSDIAALGGRIDVNNVVGAGAMFNIYLPVSLSVAQVVLVRAGQKVFAIPTVMIEQVQKLKANALESAYQNGKIDWAGREYPLHFLSRLIGDVEQQPQAQLYAPVILMRSGTYRTAVHVDEVIGNQEVVMKPMGTQLSYVPGMIGASVLGDGAIVLVINAVQLANREVLAAGTIRATVETTVIESTSKVVLVVDDSLTMRKVLSRVLEREDYEVITANDGVDAIQVLQEVTPDIILTDIEMPRMDGFELSRYVRYNPVTAKIPLVVISSRTADKHRNVAKEIGVDAYLGKPVQDEELLAQVKALLNS